MDEIDGQVMKEQLAWCVRQHIKHSAQGWKCL